MTMFTSQPGALAPAAVRKRRVYFAFHYQNDIWRVNQVRQSWRYRHEAEREAEGFFDASLWETSKRTNEESLKRLMRDGLNNTSVTCVLAGAQTYARRWVRYEIAQSVVRGNGLLTVHIHGLRDRYGYGCNPGPNPLASMGVYRARDGRILLAEHSGGRWVAYGDYTLHVELPAGWRRPVDVNVIQLSAYTQVFDYARSAGSANFSEWVRAAAVAARR